MDRGAWRATVNGSHRVIRAWATEHTHSPFYRQEADPRGVMMSSNARGQYYGGEIDPKRSHLHLDEFKEVAE